MLQSDVARKYKISSLSYSDLFPGPVPKFVESKSKKMPQCLSPRGKAAHMKTMKKESKESKLREKKEEKNNKNSSDENPKKRGRPSLSNEEKLSRKL